MLIKKKAGLLILLVCIAFSSVCFGLESFEVKVDGNGKQIEVSPDLYGVFYEEINHAGDGGIYAELVENRSFEEMEMSDNCRIEGTLLITDNGWRYGLKFDSNMHSWSPVEGSGEVKLSIDKNNPLNENTPNSLKVKVTGASGDSGTAGFANDGYWGMSVVDGDKYYLSLYARSESEKVNLIVSLQSEDGSKVYAKKTIKGVGGDWKKYKATLKSNATDPKAKLVVMLDGSATMWFDVVSLFPAKTFNNRKNGMRRDLMGKLEGLMPQFLRFPGGCVVEGCTIDNRIKWKETIGDIAQRPGHWNLWGYRTTEGLGFHEYLQMAEDLGSEVMYVANVGMSCQARHSEMITDTDTIVNVYLQDTLDALEYAMGSKNTKYGAMRIQNGHKKPFKIKYVEIGNENGGPEYHKHYKIFYDGIKAKYPDIITIADQPIPNAEVEIIDEHYYVDPSWFIANANKYDSYDRNGPKIYVGEYAVNRGVGSGNLMGAIAEATFMMGMENNSDVVVMASYAPLFENANDREWPVNLIRFDSSRSIGRSSYYVQKMLSENLPTRMLESEVLLEPAKKEKYAGKMGLRTWRADAEFKDIVVTRGDDVLYKSDFANGAEGWNVRSGNWSVENGVYRHSDANAQDTLALFGDDSWTDYTIELKAKRNGGDEGFMVVFCNKAGKHLQWNLGGWSNDKHAIQIINHGSASILTEKKGEIEIGKWYDVKIALKDNHVKCYLDGELIHSVDIKINEPKVCFANAGIDDKTGELILKMVNSTEMPVDAKIDLSGFGKLSSSATVITLTGDKPTDENTFEDPMKISPVESKFDGVKDNFIYRLEPLSVTALRIPAKL